MDETARYNIERWRLLVEADALFTRPLLDLDAAEARERLDPDGRLGDVAGLDVLCLAGGGGQQSAAFAVLGARVTVYDLSDAQLKQDRLVAAHYGVTIRTEQGDMRDLQQFTAASFDVVWQPYSLNFVPEVAPVFQEVVRVLRLGGLYRFTCANPFFGGLTERDWDGTGYALRRPYLAGAELVYEDQPWVYERTEDMAEPIPPPREYLHTLGGIADGLVDNGFLIEVISDSTDIHPDLAAAPGTWAHFTAVAPPWLTFWARLRPDVTVRGIRRV